MFHLSSIYFTAVFLTGFLLGAIRQTLIIPLFQITRSQGELIEIPIMILIIIFWARWLVLQYGIPAVARTRLAVGGVAMGMLVVVELLGETFGNGGTKRDMDGMYWVAKTAFGIAVLILGAMPWILMVLGY